MTKQQPRQLTSEQFRESALLFGYEVAPERVERVTIQGNAILQAIDQLDDKALQEVEPATICRVPYEPW